MYSWVVAKAEFYHDGKWSTSSPWKSWKIPEEEKEKAKMAPKLSRGTAGRLYVWPPNTPNPEFKVPSVTTIMNEYAKPWLGPWMSKEAAKFASENLDSLMAMPREAVYDIINRASRRKSESSMGKGTKIHEALDSFLKNEPVDIDALPQIGAGIAFLQDHVAEVIYTEATVFNLTYQYAGTLDNVSRLTDGRIAVIDYKSGARIYPEVALQLSAYANGEFIGLDTGEAIDMPQIDLGLVVHLRDDGSYRASEIELTDGLFRAFVALRTLTKYRAYIEPDVFGPILKGSAKVADEETKEGE